MYSAAVDTLIETGRVIKRSFLLEIRNGFSACDDPPGEYIWIPVIDFEIEVTESVPTIGSLRATLAIRDFEYFDEFDHEYYDPGNPVMLYAEARLQCTVYLETGTGLAGNISGVAGTQTITGAGTAFLTDFVPGDLIYLNAFPEIRLMVRDVINDTQLDVYEIVPDAFAGAAYSIVDAEREYLFRGFITDRQIQDKNIIVECYDWLEKLQTCLTDFLLEADYVAGSPFANAVLQREPVLDAGTNTIFEIDPALHPWAENPSGQNRVFVPAAYEIQENLPPWTLIEASEYQIIEGLGLIEFKEDRGPASAFRIVSVSVYQEGTLELEDIYTAVLTGDSTGDWPDCLNVACGFDDTAWREPLTGTFSFTNGNVNVVGIGCAFDTELTPGDRIAHNATPTDFGIVASVTNANNLVLQYPYPGGTAGPLAGFKSTLRWSGLSITRVEWHYCDGTAANLMRLLQRDYADVRGYRIWYDPMDDVVRGDRVEIRVEPDPRIMDLGLIGGLTTDITGENFYSAIAVKGTLDRAKNYTTDAGVATTLDAEIAGWLPGTSQGSGYGTYGNMTWSIVPGAGNAELALRDTSIENAYPVYFKFATYALADAAELVWEDYITLDLGVEINLGDIIIYNINCKNENNYSQGVWLQYSTDGVNFYDILTCYRLEFAVNEMKVISASAYTARYIRIKCRPFKWVDKGRERTFGLREIIIFGSEDLCEMVCVQNDDIGGGRTVGGVFISDFYPEIIKKLCNVGHQVLIDDSGLVLSREEAIDRGYLLLNEYIRLYRQITWTGAFDPRIQIYRTVHTRDTYREGATDELYFICESLTINNDSTVIAGTEYGAGVLAPNYS